MKTPEQEARELLARLGYTEYRTNGDLVELANLFNYVHKLERRRDGLLATIAKLSNELPFPDELRAWDAQRKALLAEVGTLRARVAELELESDELERDIAELGRERDEWRRRAAAHGFDIENGDADCG